VWEVRVKKEDRNTAFFTCTQLILTPPWFEATM
jgi:hypothetical protein